MVGRTRSSGVISSPIRRKRLPKLLEAVAAEIKGAGIRLISAGASHSSMEGSTSHAPTATARPAATCQRCAMKASRRLKPSLSRRCDFQPESPPLRIATMTFD